MLKTIEEKLSAIKAINEQKDKIDNVLQRMDLNPNKALQLMVDEIPLDELIAGTMPQQIENLVRASLRSKRDKLMEQATELMK